ncbi:hypothetical protein [Colwellia sp. RSH04]|uniref:hypothetical protein n=1 Tax=Colwellia sp. RSH04 TaxID=2305464 RepID=UPI000E5763B7|nr:hypothetical protein [Colwellia sp. RSH04]RHW74935.1 hypothetical protein D1094_16030 [Colwellia sp. RSH04]
MKLCNVVMFGMLVMFNAAASTEQTNLAPPSLVQDYFDYCNEIRPDDEADLNEYSLNCVNGQLSDAGFDTFTLYKEMIEHMNKEDE